jgi:hypothetical protein
MITALAAFCIDDFQLFDDMVAFQELKRISKVIHAPYNTQYSFSCSFGRSPNIEWTKKDANPPMIAQTSHVKPQWGLGFCGLDATQAPKTKKTDFAPVHMDSDNDVLTAVSG